MIYETDGAEIADEGTVTIRTYAHEVVDVIAENPSQTVQEFNNRVDDWDVKRYDDGIGQRMVINEEGDKVWADIRIQRPVKSE